jgi:S-(hydroxymethyl)glutathione dehydrogenase/alcohol dehydrogenase
MVEEIEVDSPRAGEVLIEWKVAGLCHSDEHIRTGTMVPVDGAGEPAIDDYFPIVGGHEGSGVVVEVGPGVRSLAVGDHVSASFVPSCGRCRWCSTGYQNLCDQGAYTMRKGMITDGVSRHRGGAGDLNLFAKLGTFSRWTCIDESQAIKVDDDLPLEAVALVSCGVATGWGAATERSDVRPGDTVVVVGVGGVGINAVQGAAAAGARHVIAIDPVSLKRETAMELGATHVFAGMEEAIDPVRELTWGTMADEVILAPGDMWGELMAPALTLVSKAGTVVVVGVAPRTQKQISVDLFDLAMTNKEIKGTIFGSLNPRADIPKLLGLYRDGRLKLDELITAAYPLDQINDGYQAMREGRNVRGVILHA